MSKRNKLAKTLIIILVIVFVISVAYLVYYFYSKHKEKEDIREAQEYIPETIEEEHTEEKTAKMLKVEEMKNENSDIKAWIEIENTKINYPVLQSEDDEFYVTHNHKKEKSKYGAIYIKGICDINDNNANIIAYGHNMKDGEMFNNLLKYKDKSFYEEHKIINLTTENEERKYEIIAAFKSRVFYTDEVDVFRYYRYTNFDNEEKYNEFISNVKKIQLYDTGISASFGEQLLTMITCEYSTENGRMVVVAKRI